MESVESFVVKWAGLANGTHAFCFHGGASFFDEDILSFDSINAADISFDIQMIKEEMLLQFDIQLTGTLSTLCDHCGGVLELPINGSRQLIAKPGLKEQNEIGSDVLYFTEDCHTIDLFEYLYETAVLNLPLRKVHEKELCDKQIESQLSDSSEVHDQEVDPRWEALKSLNID